jgi:hypothetical protein
MARKRYKPEEIVAKLRQVDVLVSQGQGPGRLAGPRGARIPAVGRCGGHHPVRRVEQSVRACRREFRVALTPLDLRARRFIDGDENARRFSAKFHKFETGLLVRAGTVVACSSYCFKWRLYHFNGITSWGIAENGEVKHVYA